jgi:hypothetical protein
MMLWRDVSAAKPVVIAWLVAVAIVSKRWRAVGTVMFDIAHTKSVAVNRMIKS